MVDEELNTSPKKASDEPTAADSAESSGEEQREVTPPWIAPGSQEQASEASGKPATGISVGTGPAPPPRHHGHTDADRESLAERRMFELRLEEAHTLMQLAANKLQQIEDDTYRFMTTEQREEILADIVALSHRTGTISSRCVYCRRELTKPMGTCAMCGRDVCTECGQRVGDAVLHRGNCAMFYQQKK